MNQKSPKGELGHFFQQTCIVVVSLSWFRPLNLYREFPGTDGKQETGRWEYHLHSVPWDTYHVFTRITRFIAGLNKPINGFFLLKKKTEKLKNCVVNANPSRGLFISVLVTVVLIIIIISEKWSNRYRWRQPFAIRSFVLFVSAAEHERQSQRLKRLGTINSS